MTTTNTEPLSKKEQREKLFKMQEGLCIYCRQPMRMCDVTEEHLTPKSKGGKRTGNIALAHAFCNHKRGNKSLEKFRAVCLERAEQPGSFGMTDTYRRIAQTLEELIKKQL